MSKLRKAVQGHRHQATEEDIAAMAFVCPICGSTAFPPSTIILRANYGSTHDGARVTVNICGECFDVLADAANILAAAIPKMA